MIIRKAEKIDIPAVAAIYDAIHTEEESGRAVIGWQRGIYPTEETAIAALSEGCLFVMEDGGEIVASARINSDQEDVYSEIAWLYDADPEEVLVMHTLTVSPLKKGSGYGTAFERYYAELAKKRGCRALRIDTNEKNSAARRLYSRLGYREAGTVPCTFNGIGGVNLVCLEKKL